MTDILGSLSDGGSLYGDSPADNPLTKLGDAPDTGLSATPAVPPQAMSRAEALHDHVFNAQQDYLELQQRIDDRARLRIQQQITDSRAREDELLKGLQEAQGAFHAPPPAPTSVTMSPAEMWTAGLAGILGGNFAQGANLGEDAAGRRQALEYQNQQNAYVFDQANATRGYDMARGQFEDAHRETAALQNHLAGAEGQFAGDESRVAIAAMQDQQKTEEERQKGLEQLQDDYGRAKDPGTADQLRQRIAKEYGPQYAPTDQQYSAKVAVLGQRAVKDFNAKVQAVWQHASQVSDADQVALDQERQGLLATYPGLDARQLAQVPTSQTLSAKRQADQAAMAKERYALAEQRFTWLKGAKKTEIAQRWTAITIAKDQLQVAQQNAELHGDSVSLQMAKYLRGDVDKQTFALVKDAAKKVREIDAQIRGQQALANDGRNVHQIDARAKLPELNAEREYWQGIVNEQNGYRAESALPFVTPEDALSQARQYVGQQTANHPGAATAENGPLVYSGGHDPSGVVSYGGAKRSISDLLDMANAKVAAGKVTREQARQILKGFGVTAQ